MPYIPENHRKYDLLPLCKELGGEVFEYPHLLNELEDEGVKGLMPYGFKSCEEYYDKLDKIICSFRNSTLYEKLVEFRQCMIELNNKDKWSILRYIGKSNTELTNGQCYYCTGVSYIGKLPFFKIIDNEEFTSYLYGAEKSSWELMYSPDEEVRRVLLRS